MRKTNTLKVESVKKIYLALLCFSLLSASHPPPSFGLPAEDVQLVTNTEYVPAARKLIKEAKHSIRVMMFEMAFYERRSNSPSNLLIKELIEAKKRGVSVEVILEVSESNDRTTERNRRSGKILSQGGVDVIYDTVSRTTHAKLLLVDGEFILLGSTNWTYSALSNNNETSVLIRSKALAKELIDYVNKVKSTGSKR